MFHKIWKCSNVGACLKKNNLRLEILLFLFSFGKTVSFLLNGICKRARIMDTLFDTIAIEVWTERILFFSKLQNRKVSFFLPKENWFIFSLSKQCLHFFVGSLVDNSAILQSLFESKVFNLFGTTVSKTPRLFTLRNSYQLRIEKKVKVFCSVAKLKKEFCCFSSQVKKLNT